VVWETEKPKAVGYSLNNFLSRVDLPTPEGPEKTTGTSLFFEFEDMLRLLKLLMICWLLENLFVCFFMLEVWLRRSFER